MLISPLSIISIIVWLIVPTRYWKKRFFFFFLILGLSDLIAHFLYQVLNIMLINIYVISSYLSLVSLQTSSFVKKYSYFVIILFSIAIFAAIPNEFLEYQLILLSLHIIIFIRILYLFIYDVGNFSRVNFFYVLLLLYEITVISKFLNVSLNLVDGVTYFHFTTIFELFIGLFFIVFRYDNPRIVFQLK